jgi:hypothetical protein
MLDKSGFSLDISGNRATMKVAPTFPALDSFEESCVVGVEVADVVDAVLL